MSRVQRVSRVGVMEESSFTGISGHSHSASAVVLLVIMVRLGAVILSVVSLVVCLLWFQW